MVISRTLNPPKKVGASRGIEGRLLFWDHLFSSLSSVLVSNPSETDNHDVETAGYPVPSPPELPGEVIPIVADDDEAFAPEPAADVPVPHPEEEPGTWGGRLRDDRPPDAIDLDEDDMTVAGVWTQRTPDDLFILTSSLDENTPQEIRDEIIDQSLTVPMTDIKASSGAEREKWVAAAKKEIDTLIASKTISSITLAQRDTLKHKCKADGSQYSELPCKGVFTIKPDKYKARICGCGNFEHDTYGTTATNEMDACIMRYLLSWHASKLTQDGKPVPEDDQQVLSSLDYTGAFLNAELPEGRVIVLRPPAIFTWLGIIPPNTYWLLHRALYGLRESPMLWGNTRDKGFTDVRIPYKGEIYQLLQTTTHPSLWMIVRKNDVRATPVLTDQDLPIKVDPTRIHGLIGVFVDDLLKTGKRGLVNAVITKIRKLWKAGEPDFLTPS
eukprot:2062740-Amphidinium_carterae.1